MSNPTLDTLRNVRAEVVASLAKIAKAHGLKSLTASLGSYSPNDGSFTFKVEGACKGGKTSDDRDNELYDMRRKFDKSLPKRGTMIEVRGTKYRIEGATSRGSFRILRLNDRKVFRASHDYVMHALGR